LPRTGFTKELQELEDDVLLMGSMVDKAIERATESMESRDIELANRVVKEDMSINRKRYSIEEHCLNLIARQQPMAKDLRVISSVMHIIVELERIGDYAEGIAKITVMMADEPPLKPLIDIPRMAEKARSMLGRSLDAFIAADVEAATSIAEEDDEVDALYDQVYRELLTFMIEDPRTISRATYLLWAAHNLERIADRVTNICERTVYMATGHIEEMNISTY
jgi:phosphate transport system protein